MTEKCVTCNGQQLKHLATAGLHWLQSNYQYVNELNVFPVPDGDTGDNMRMTMENAHKEVLAETSNNASKVAGKIAHGAMMGSRGNSGTILSQIWLGFARTLGDAETLDVDLLAKALREATETAYRGVQRPVEGTILTVIREITETVEAEVGKTDDLIVILNKMVESGWASVERTPEHLPTLKKAGVVDSGGVGLLYVLEGMQRYLRGEEVQVATSHAADIDFDHIDEGPQIAHPGENIYDVQFVLKAKDLDATAIKATMEEMGDSVVVVGTDTAVKVHVHVPNPGVPLQYAAAMAPISDIVVENMEEQYYEYLAMRTSSQTSEPIEYKAIEAGQIAVIAVAAGQGMAKVFADLGVAGVVNGGQTNNPSTEEMLSAIQALATNKVILLPNNKNIILTAEQVTNLVTGYDIKVIPTRTFPQGVSALFAYEADGDLDEIAEAMREAKDDIVTAEVTHATRTVELDGVSVREGQVIGLLDGKLKVSGDEIEAVIKELLELADLDELELITLYYGMDSTAEEAQKLADKLSEDYADLEFEIIAGGQSHYPYVIGME